MTIIRVKFRRGDEVKFISHLDLMKVFERAIRRARLPIAYSQGFNPHPGMVFGLPLGVGVTSEAEYGDFEITDDEMSAQEFADRLNLQLPKGMEVLAAKKKVSKQNIMATIAASEYIVIVGTPAECNQKTLKTAIDKYLSQKEIVVKKRTKNGVKDTDIRDMIFDLNFELQPFGTFNIIRFTALVSAGSKANLKPDLLIESLCGYLGIEYEIDRIHRTKLFVRSQDQLLDPMEEVV
ncbi:TIGR03936 family radical SAM-associated protein [Clostridium sp. BNL1100]|uniref:TIGR03936 family radical SAM-associated protein n=1 Tax=Clostridium sp. BNL1100 TaxID=755731 RepID=UPI00024A7A21|nr:TIGR03936 family radical SAM-associated protein [Clostridium sp. BNL1100]AEY65255.1 radical SAM-linked protein [Clostridium sp. BNL1100]